MSLVAVLAVIFGLKQIAQDGDRARRPWHRSSVGLVVGTLWVRRQLTLAEPDDRPAAVPHPDVQRRARRQLAGVFVAVGYFLFIAQYLQLVLGLSPLRRVLWSVPVGDRLHRRVHARAADRRIGSGRRYVMGVGPGARGLGLGVLTQVGGARPRRRRRRVAS